jgi:hypothetical protein
MTVTTAVNYFVYFQRQSHDVYSTFFFLTHAEDTVAQDDMDYQTQQQGCLFCPGVARRACMTYDVTSRGAG